MAFRLSDLPPDVRKALGLTKPKTKRAKTPPRQPVPVTENRQWTFVVPDYLPPSLNQFVDRHWTKRMQFKKECVELFSHYGRDVPKAESKRTVLFTLVRTGHDKEMDADNAAKKVGLDALKRCGLIVDDNEKWCECPKPVQIRGTERQTIVTLCEVVEVPDA